jgi:hypothetical protein
MRIVQTLVVRDEIDIIEAQIAYHLAAGVDFVIATDHESVDGTSDVLRRFEQAGQLRRIPVAGPVEESAWRTRMARLAATEHGADWVVNTDADEFWLPKQGSLKDVLGAVPEAFGVVWALSRHFLPRPATSPSFAERMTVRASPSVAVNDPASPVRPHAKVAHRADAAIEVGFGAHLVHGTALRPLPHWHVADVLHFPYRSIEQYERKGRRRAASDKRMAQYVKALSASESGRLEETYASLFVTDEVLERGLASGSLVVDTRLRDAMRAIAEGRCPPSFGGGAPCDRADAARRIAEAAALRDADAVRVQRRLDGLGHRLRDVERRRWARARRSTLRHRSSVRLISEARPA